MNNEQEDYLIRLGVAEEGDDWDTLADLGVRGVRTELIMTEMGPWTGHPHVHGGSISITGALTVDNTSTGLTVDNTSITIGYDNHIPEGMLNQAGDMYTRDNTIYMYVDENQGWVEIDENTELDT